MSSNTSNNAAVAAAQPARAFGADLPPWPQVDFAEFGPIEVIPLSRLQKLTGNYLARNWVTIPHVTHHDDADITEVELKRRKANAAAPVEKLSLLPYLIKAVVAALKEFPRFNASLDAASTRLVLKKYFHIGVAVDTRFGLLVPVLKDCDTKSIPELARELAAVSGKARDKGLTLAEMSGGCFTISSLGGIGGTGFSPIINAPELAILGVTRTQLKPRPYENGEIEWRQALPLSLSYDHRVINGADAARFTAFLARVLEDPRRLEV